MPNRKQEIRPWHAERADVAFATLGTPPCGLTEQEWSRRQQEYGPNLLPDKGRPPLWLILLRQLTPNLLLVEAAVIGNLKETGFIATVLAICPVFPLQV